MVNVNKVKIMDNQLENLIKEIIKYFYDKNRDQIRYKYKEILENVTQKIDKIKNLNELDLEEFVKPNGICEGISIGLNFKKSQFRKFYNEIKNIKIKINKLNDNQNNEEINKIGIQLISLIPKLAYSKGRNLIDDSFFKFMKTMITKLRNKINKENFEILDKVLETILAYHTYYYPKEN
ncbi:MAG: type III-A CRISPR-associated protein Csm2 [bacterium]|jgi:CRISPR-associated protein Csm2